MSKLLFLNANVLEKNANLTVAEVFSDFLENIKIDNATTITNRYQEVTTTLNKKFRETSSKTNNSLQVGSYGRWTGIKGISDLDMLYIMPKNKWDDYSDNQSQLLKDVKDALKGRYPSSDIKVDRLVVVVQFQNFQIEVQPVFKDKDGDFKYPDTYNGGSWKPTKPQKEISAMREFVDTKNQNLRKLCKMTRAWKNKHGVAMAGLLIDTLAYNFLKSTDVYDNKRTAYYDVMVRDFFLFLSEQDDHDHYKALGSNQNVKVKQPFQKKAKKAYDLTINAINSVGQKNYRSQWRKVFGKSFPISTEEKKLNDTRSLTGNYTNTEQFIEDSHPIDIKYNLKIDCTVKEEATNMKSFLRQMKRKRKKISGKKKLHFYIDPIDNKIIHSDNYTMFWKVLNRGKEAIRLDKIRGEIEIDGGNKEKVEIADFKGDHIVECYIVMNNVVVAKDRIDVPIE